MSEIIQLQNILYKVHTWGVVGEEGGVIEDFCNV